jgi:hypothetical protein
MPDLTLIGDYTPVHKPSSYLSSRLDAALCSGVIRESVPPICSCRIPRSVKGSLF